jgi:hypothetical protein
MRAKNALGLLCLPWVLVSSCGDAEIVDDSGHGGAGGEVHGGNAGSPGGGSAGDGPSIGGPDFRLTFEELVLEGDPLLVTHFEFLPGSYEFLATTHTGRVLHYELDGDRARLLGDFEIGDTFAESDCGLLSLTFDPAFDENGLVYLGYCTSVTHSAIVQYHFDPNDYAGIEATKKHILTVGDDDAELPRHAVGKLGFDPRGNLWALFGEKGLGSQARNPNSLLGSVVRLRPLVNGGYEGPDPPNPVLPGSPPIPLMYAYGLRSPWTGTLDAAGRFWIGDVGNNGDQSFEEINLVTEPGLDFGWNLRQGPCQEDCAGQRDPTVSWQRRPIGERELEDSELGASTKRVAWVGLEYRETERDRYDGLMHGKVLYGDMCLGFVRGIEVDEDEKIVFDRHLGHLEGASAWKVGPDGYIYASVYASCLGRVASATPPVSRLVRARLSRD